MKPFSKSTTLPGAILLPRAAADRGDMNWPKCARCMRSVDAYGIENETDAYIEIWVKCGGVRMDPSSGLASGLSGRIHEPMKTSTFLMKGIGWSPQRFTDIIRRQAFFHPDGDRQWKQDITPNGVKALS